ncbi:MAG: hypothetical protein LC099_03805 [Anaerolineales bacterium]|nr:hypothetical protein [Anaerolineales bacterium]
MSKTGFFAKFLRFIGIVLMFLTGGLTILGGIGTACAAFLPTNFESMAPLAPFQWLYILFVLTGVAIGIMGIRAGILLVKGAETAYRDTLIALISGVVVGVIHIVASRALRGSSMPVDAVVYASVITLVVFLLFRIPGIWQGVDFRKGDLKSNKPAAAISAILVGIMTLTIQYAMASTHTWDGVNYADAFNASLTLLGGSLVVFGAALFVRWERLEESIRKTALAHK